jgi:hypothetical protein
MIPDFQPVQANIIKPVIDYIPPNKTYEDMIKERQANRDAILPTLNESEKNMYMLAEHMLASSAGQVAEINVAPLDAVVGNAENVDVFGQQEETEAIKK